MTKVQIVANPCSFGVEAIIEAPSGTPVSFGPDVRLPGAVSVTGGITVNSGNHHGLRYWDGQKWEYDWHD